MPDLFTTAAPAPKHATDQPICIACHEPVGVHHCSVNGLIYCIACWARQGGKGTDTPLPSQSEGDAAELRSIRHGLSIASLYGGNAVLTSKQAGVVLRALNRQEPINAD